MDEINMDTLCPFAARSIWELTQSTGCLSQRATNVSNYVSDIHGKLIWPLSWFLLMENIIPLRRLPLSDPWTPVNVLHQCLSFSWRRTFSHHRDSDFFRVICSTVRRFLRKRSLGVLICHRVAAWGATAYTISLWLVSFRCGQYVYNFRLVVLFSEL